MMNNIRLGLALSLAGLAANVALAVHPYHVSLTEIERNPKSGNLEIAMCLWPNDVELALKKMEKRPIDLDKEKNLDELLERYISRQFELELDGKKSSKIRWVGHETDNKQTWVYFEIPAQSASRFELKNRVFFELNDDQQNEIRIRTSKHHRSLSFHSLSAPIKFAF